MRPVEVFLTARSAAAPGFCPMGLASVPALAPRLEIVALMVMQNVLRVSVAAWMVPAVCPVPARRMGLRNACTSFSVVDQDEQCAMRVRRALERSRRRRILEEKAGDLLKKRGGGRKN